MHSSQALRDIFAPDLTPRGPATNDAVDSLIQVAGQDFQDAALQLRAWTWDERRAATQLRAQADRLLAQHRDGEVATLVYLLGEISRLDLALAFAEHAYRGAPEADQICIALADIWHRRGDCERAFTLTERHLRDSSSDALIIKFSDFARDLGKSFLAEDALTRFVRRGRTSLRIRLAEHYLESRNWAALRDCLAQAVTDLTDYEVYLLGRANVSLLLESDVIACADRLWTMANPGRRYAQLLLDVWRWRIGEIECDAPRQDPAGLPYWLAQDAQSIRDAGAHCFDLATTVRSSTGWRTMRPRQNLPNVIGIGTQRSASTWLHYQLSQRPDIQPLPNKEPVFFSDAIASLRDVDPLYAEGGASEDPYWFGPTRNLFRYLRLFGAGFAIRADFSPSYIELREPSIAAICDILGPDVRILLSVRDPVERSWSNLKFDLKLSNVALASVSLPERIAHYTSDVSYRRSDYATTFLLWSKYFKLVRVLFFDDIGTRPAAMLNEVTDFIGVPRGEPLPGLQRLNPSLDGNIPAADRMFLLGLHRQHYDQAEALLGGPALTWRAKHFALMT